MTATAPGRHGGDLTRLLARMGSIATALLVATTGCGGSLPRPPRGQVARTDYVPVTFPPRTPPIEVVPPRPAEGGAVWVDGSWEWAGNRYGWRYGTWLVPPPGARHAAWALVRRAEDGQLFFAPSTWKDAKGATVDDRSFRNTLGPRAQARSRIGDDGEGRGPDPGPSYAPPDDEP